MVRAGLEILPKPDFHLIRMGQRNFFSFRDLLLLQFKKLKHNLTTSNSPTHQSELFDLIGEVSGLPGIEESIPLLSAGYVARPIYGLEGIFITRIVNREPEWFHRIDDENDQSSRITSILPPYDPNISQQVQPSRIRRDPNRGLPDTGTGQS